MTCEICSSNTDTFGAEPARVQWKIVRGDSAFLKVEFLEDDEITPTDMTGWTFVSSVYNKVSGIVEPLILTVGVGYVEISITSLMSSAWGDGFENIVSEMPFDLQVTKPNSNRWTPIIGTICVLGDVTGGSL